MIIFLVAKFLIIRFGDQFFLVVQIGDQKMAIEFFLVARSMVKIKPLSIGKLNLIG
jgi:hypothetical protein